MRRNLQPVSVVLRGRLSSVTWVGVGHVKWGATSRVIVQINMPTNRRMHEILYR